MRSARSEAGCGGEVAAIALERSKNGCGNKTSNLELCSRGVSQLGGPLLPVKSVAECTQAWPEQPVEVTKVMGDEDAGVLIAQCGTTEIGELLMRAPEAAADV